MITISKEEWESILCSVYETGFRDAVDKIKNTHFDCDSIKESRRELLMQIFDDMGKKEKNKNE